MLRTLDSAGNLLSKMGEVLEIDKNRCVRLRHKLSTCTECIEKCPVDAIEIGVVGSGIDINWNACTECGICYSVCPTGVFKLKGFSEKTLLTSARQNMVDDGSVEFYCHKVDEHKAAGTVPIHCFGSIQSSHLVYMYSQGIKNTHFYHGECEQCDLKTGVEALQVQIDEAETLIHAFEEDARLKFDISNKSADFIDYNIASKKQISVSKSGENVDRRGLFRFWKEKSRDTAIKTVEGVISGEISTSVKRIEYSSLLPVKRKILLKALRTFDEPDQRYLEANKTKDLLDLKMEPDRCNYCGICYKFCPTGALEYFKSPEKANGQVFEGIGFLSDQCVKCDLCIVSCLENALSYDDYIDLNRLQAGQEKLLVFREVTGLEEEKYGRRTPGWTPPRS